MFRATSHWRNANESSKMLPQIKWLKLHRLAIRGGGRNVEMRLSYAARGDGNAIIILENNLLSSYNVEHLPQG